MYVSFFRVCCSSWSMTEKNTPQFLQIISEVYLLSHLKGMKHQAALLTLDHDPTSIIVEAAEEHQGPEQSRPEVEERLRAGKKESKKTAPKNGQQVLFLSLSLCLSISLSLSPLSSRAREQESKTLQSQLTTSPSKIRSKFVVPFKTSTTLSLSLSLSLPLSLSLSLSLSLPSPP